VTLFNGRDGEWNGRIAALGRNAGAVTLADNLRAQHAESDLWLVFAPVKRAPLEYLLEKATELGVGAFHPVITRHTVIERLNLDRWRVHVREAAEQSERLTVPEIAAPQALERILATWPSTRRLVLCDESGSAPPIAAALGSLAPAPLAVLTGPEGGFAESELDALRKLPFVSAVGLGPRVLRSETAALAAVAVVQALAGDWGAARERRGSATAKASP
jgi:16S rRNA (uracil1498-N3)-methyltransferase